MKRMLGAPLLLLLAVVLGLAANVPSGYGVIRPGGAYDVGSRLEIPDERRQEMGHLAFTAVLAGDADWLEVAGAWLDPSVEIVPRESIRPSGVSRSELNEINRRLMEESQSVAAAVALRMAGFDVEIAGQGAEVHGVVAGMPAAGVLHEGDVIVAVDGQPVQTALEVVELTRRHELGQEVRLTVVRDGERQDVVVGTVGSTEEPGRPVVGALIGTRGFDVRLPFPVGIDVSGVGGPSAGLMFTLGILDGVTEGDLTGGTYVAGTGTISADGSVGPIGGAAQKVIAAERDGARVFLVPRDNAAEARAHAHTITVVPVDTSEDAVGALCGLARSPDVAVPPLCQRYGAATAG